MNRRTFLKTAAIGATAAGLTPLVARTAKDQGYHVGIDPAGPGSDTSDHHAVWAPGPAIKVPSNQWYTLCEGDFRTYPACPPLHLSHRLLHVC